MCFCVHCAAIFVPGAAAVGLVVSPGGMCLAETSLARARLGCVGIYVGSRDCMFSSS